MQVGKRITTVVLPTLLVLFAMLLAACGGTNGNGNGNSGNGNQPSKAPAAQQVYRWGVSLPDINSFDSGIAPDVTSINAINMVFTGMVQLNDKLQVTPQMASSWDVSSDKMTYTFHLKPNLKFSDGTPLTSADVAYSIDRALSPDVNNQSGVALTYLGLITGAADRTTGKAKTIIGTGITTPDASTVVIKITKPASYFLQALTYPTSYVVEKSVVEKYGLAKWTDHLVDNGGQGGAGPFKVAFYDHQTMIKFVPNPNYYGPKPQLREVDYTFFKDADTSYNTYQAGQIDYTGVAPNHYQEAKGKPDFIKTPVLTIFYIGMNYLTKPLNNVKVRQGLSMAINRTVLNEAAFHGAYIPSCHIVPDGMPGYNPNLTCAGGTGVNGDAAKAKQVFQQGLQEEGLTTATFPQITFTYPTKSLTAAAAVTTMLQMWKQTLGITVNTTQIAQNTMYNLETQTTGKTGPLQMWYAGWGADYPDPQDWLTLQFGKGEPYNEFNYGNNNGATAAAQQTAQSQMAAADVMTDQAARLQAYTQVEQQLVNDVAWLSLYQRPSLRQLKSYIVGLKFNSFDEIPPDDWGGVYVSTH